MVHGFEAPYRIQRPFCRVIGQSPKAKLIVENADDWRGYDWYNFY